MNPLKKQPSEQKIKEIELKRRNSYEINFKLAEENKLDMPEYYPEHDFMENEQPSSIALVKKKKKLFSLSKKMTFFCLVLFILIAFLAINVSLLILSKSRASLQYTHHPFNNTDSTSNETIENQTIIENTTNETNENNENETLYPRFLSFLINQSDFVQMEENKLSKFIPLLNLSIYFENEDEFNIKLTDSASSRFSLPDAYPFPFTKKLTDPSKEFIRTNYLIDINNSRFSIKIRRKATLEVIFDTSNIDFFFTDRDIKFGTKLPSSYLFGLGERKAEFLYKPGKYTIWNRNSVEEQDTGTPGHQSSGTHPIYLSKEKSGMFHAVFLKNVNAMQFQFSNENELTFRIMGGIIDLKFFIGNEYPETAIKKYHSYINGFSMIPFWAFGLHQAIIGQISPEKMTQVLGKYEAEKLPIDALWSDVELMQMCNKTNNQSTFDTIKNIRKKVRFINQINLGISVNPNNEFFIAAMQEDVLIKSAKTKKPMMACQCQNKTVYPDFNHPNISRFWFDIIGRFYGKIAFDGISITMNEPTISKDFIGELKTLEESCLTSENELSSTTVFENFTGWIDESLEKIDLTGFPFSPQQNLEKETLAIDSYHYNMSNFFKVAELRELDFHNLNGFFSAYYTFLAFKHLKLQSAFLSTKSSSFGTGNFATHWIGESLFSWAALKASIATLFNANLFNMPISGIDVCSFSESSNGGELCARWIQLGSLYPLTRLRISDDPLNLGIFTFNESIVHQAAYNSLKLRYSLLKYLFSIFERIKGTGMVFKPLFFEFPEEEILYSIETQFMLGHNLMVTPVLEQNREMVTVYFPKNVNWFNFNTGEIFSNPQGFKQDIEVKINDTCPIFVKEGKVVYFQNVDNVTNSGQLDNNFYLFAAMKNFSKNEVNGEKEMLYYAEGELFAIKDYNDETILQKCRENSDSKYCFITVKIKSFIMGPPEYLTSVTVEFEAQDNSLLEEIYVVELRLFGMKNKNQYAQKIFKFEPKLKVEKNLTKTFVNS